MTWPATADERRAAAALGYSPVSPRSILAAPVSPLNDALPHTWPGSGERTTERALDAFQDTAG